MESAYQIPPDLKKQFSVGDINTYTRIFKDHDQEGTGSIDKAKVLPALKECGFRETKE